jgi:hypothetical protein
MLSPKPATAAFAGPPAEAAGPATTAAAATLIDSDEGECLLGGSEPPGYDFYGRPLFQATEPEQPHKVYLHNGDKFIGQRHAGGIRVIRWLD